MGGWACGRGFFSHSPTPPYDGKVKQLLHGSVNREGAVENSIANCNDDVTP